MSVRFKIRDIISENDSPAMNSLKSGLMKYNMAKQQMVDAIETVKHAAKEVSQQTGEDPKKLIDAAKEELGIE